MVATLQTIDEVLHELDLIIEETVSENNFLGIFAYVYRRTTAQIKEEVLNKRFEDNERMIVFDVAFAKLYIDAYRGFKENKPVSLAWQVSFDVKNQDISIVQHLLLGMNAHINLDLGIAATSVVSGDEIQDLKNDFMLVNKILKDLINEMQQRISRVSRFMFLLDWLGRRNDELLANFSIVKARKCAWNLACDLVLLNAEEKKKRIKKVDQDIAFLGNLICNPPFFMLKMALTTISKFEEKDVKKIIHQLRAEV